MVNTITRFFAFCGEENRRRFHLSILLGVLQAVFEALRIPAIACMVRALLSGSVTNRDILLSLGIMLLSIIGSGLIKAKSMMLQTEGGYDTCAKKRVEIADDWGLYHKGVDILSVLSTHEWLSCTVLWESTTAWSSGDQTVEEDLSKWQVIEAIISSGATGILTKDDSNIFRGVCFGGTSGGFFAYMPLIAVNSATSLHMNRFEQVGVSYSNTPTVDSITTQYGVVKLIGIKHV